MNIFDYLTKDTVAGRKAGEKTEVVIAGNLKREKAGYVYRLNEVEGEIQFRLYGPNYDGETQGKNVKYCGQYKPEELPEKLEGGFGLVWDGDDLGACTGVFGEYMKYNNPHKTSLYLASGLPVIIWEKAAMAKYIEKNNLGIAVREMNEIPLKLKSLSEEDYRIMKSNVEIVGKQLCQGKMLLAVLGK